MAEESPKHKPLSLFFKGCGFLLVYELGVVKAMQELAPEILRSATKIYGSSSGSIVASILTCGCELDGAYEKYCRVVKEVRNAMLGPLSPNLNVLQKLQKLLYKTLPDNAHQLAAGRLHIMLTRVSDRQSVVVSDFGSKEEIVQAVTCSCFIPAYLGYILPSFQGVRYIDGNFSSPEPSFYTKTMIIVSALAFDNDICPRDRPGTFFSFYTFQQQFQIQLENLYRAVCCFFPPSQRVVQEFFLKGYHDAGFYLERNREFGIDFLASSVTLPLASESCKKDLSQPIGGLETRTHQQGSSLPLTQLTKTSPDPME